MTTRTRIGITVIAALALGVTEYGARMSPPGRDIWEWSELAAYGLAVAAVFLVNRWWALLPAAVPSAVTFYLYTFTSYSTPWDNESLGNPDQPVTYAIVLLFVVAFEAAVLSVGFLLRWIWNAVRNSYLSKTTPRGRER
jgi:hypothetical protein